MLPSRPLTDLEQFLLLIENRLVTIESLGLTGVIIARSAFDENWVLIWVHQTDELRFPEYDRRGVPWNAGVACNYLMRGIVPDAIKE